MAKVTLTDPAENPAAVVPEVQKATVTDATGRLIMLRKPGVLAQFRLVEALGRSAQNQVYMGMVLPLLFVGSIDGAAVVPPATKGEVEALITRLDEAGIQAVMLGVQQHFTEDSEEAARKKSAE